MEGLLRMKIFIGAFLHETNTFNPHSTDIDDFFYLEGIESLGRLGSTEVFQKHGVNIVPSIYVKGLSSGIVKKETFDFFKNKIISKLKIESNLDGIWLHLHGSMEVEEIGSGELALLKEIRLHVGPEIPISLTLDTHANISADLPNYINVARSYRTVPHVDQFETEQITAQLLINLIKKKIKTKPYFIKLPLLICGEKALGNSEPLRSIFHKLEKIETTHGILTASFFLGHSWSDAKNTGASVLVVPESNEYVEAARMQASKLKNYIMNRRNQFSFNVLALSPEKTVQKSLLEKSKPIFISDSGDNPTAGAPGYNTVLLRKFKAINQKKKRILFASILSRQAYNFLNNYKIGDKVAVEVGDHFDENSKPVLLKGKLKSRGFLLGITGDKIGKVHTVSSENIDVVITDKPNSFTTMEHFKQANVDINDYDIIVVKQGYLFDELAKVSDKNIFALTEGATHLLIDTLTYQNVPDHFERI